MNRRLFGGCVAFGLAGCLGTDTKMNETNDTDEIEEPGRAEYATPDTPAMETLAEEIRDAVDYTADALEMEIEADPIVDMDEWHRSIDVRGKVGSLAFAELAHQHGAVVSAVMAGPDDHGDDVTRVWFRSLDELADTRDNNDLPEWQANRSDNSGNADS